MPSWEEGFGFPVLEALAAGTPAVVSDLPVFAETVGEGALRVPTGDEAALAGAMTQIAGDPDLRRRLVAAGEPALARYSWTGAAQAMRALLAGAAA